MPANETKIFVSVSDIFPGVGSDFETFKSLLSTLSRTNLGIWAEDELVDRIHSRNQADIQRLLNAGLSFSTKFSASSGESLLTLELLDPEA